MKRHALLVAFLMGAVVAQLNAPFEELELRARPDRYGPAYSETINPVGTYVLLENQNVDGSVDRTTQDRWLTAYETAAVSVPPSSCGNGIVEGLEQCDPMIDFNTNPLCTALGYVPLSPTTHVGCTTSCTFDRQGAPSADFGCSGGNPLITRGNCGNSAIDAFEQCDNGDGAANPLNLGGATCQSLGLGFDGGVLGCLSISGIPLCHYDVSGCTRSTPGCGNGIIEGAEQCDPPGQSAVACSSIGLAGGFAACSATCNYDYAVCNPFATVEGLGFEGAHPAIPYSPVKCGDNVVDSWEECDGVALKGQTCASFGYNSGTLTCTGCNFDLRGCTTQAGLVTVAAIGENVTVVEVGDVVLLSDPNSCRTFSMNTFVETRGLYCLVNESQIAATLLEGNLFADKTNVISQGGWRRTIPLSGDWSDRSQF